MILSIGPNKRDLKHSLSQKKLRATFMLHLFNDVTSHYTTLEHCYILRKETKSTKKTKFKIFEP